MTFGYSLLTALLRREDSRTLYGIRNSPKTELPQESFQFPVRPRQVDSVTKAGEATADGELRLAGVNFPWVDIKHKRHLGRAEDVP